VTLASRTHHRHRPPGQPRPDRFHLQGRGRHELLQLLVIHPETTGHRLHRLPAPVPHQTAQRQPTLHPLFRTLQRREHLPGKLLQPRGECSLCIGQGQQAVPKSALVACSN
jgi:hypothetical protein